MSAPVVTGANLFRATRVLSAADIFALDTSEMLLVPALLGKVLVVVGPIISKMLPGSEPYTPSGGPTTTIVYGSPSTGLMATSGDALTPLAATAPTLYTLDPDEPNTLSSPYPENTGLYLAKQTGSLGPIGDIAINAPGTGYAIGDAGLINGAPFIFGNATYQVTAVDGGGGVTGVILTFGGGNDYTTFPNVGTVATSGGGSGLTLDITQQAQAYATGPITGITIAAAGSGYAINDTGLIDGIPFTGGTAAYKVTAVNGGGGVTAAILTAGGAGYYSLSDVGTTVTTGGGDGMLAFNITAGLAGNGTLQIEVMFATI